MKDSVSHPDPAKVPRGFLRKAADLYVDGFRNMTVGRTLWAIIILKVVILLGVFKVLFFPDVLSRDYDTDEERADAVRRTLVERSATPGQ